MKRWFKTALAFAAAGGGLIASSPAFAAFPDPYCNRVFADGREPITRVKISDIDKVSPAAVAGALSLEDFTAIVGQLRPGATYTIATEGNSDGNFPNVYRVYFDWNHDNVFTEGAAERYEIGTITNSTGTDGKQAVAYVTVPTGALSGQTRMRVVKKYSTAGSACGGDDASGTSFGQAEDYTVNVDTANPMPAAIPTLSQAFSPTNGDVAATTTLTLSLGQLNAVASLNLTADLVNTFPTGMTIAATPAASTTCPSGALTATAGAGSVTLATGAQIPVAGCTVKVNVQVAAPGIYVNTIAANSLKTDGGNVAGAVSATYQATSPGFVNYSVGFEAPDYTVANLNGQKGWFTSVVADWKVATTHPGTGLQHVRGTWTTAGSGTSFMLSPTQPNGTTTYSIASAKLAITVAGTGATWDFAPQDPGAGSVITRVRFLKGAGNKIQALDPDAPGADPITGYVDTGATWSGGGTFFDIKVIAKRSDNTYKVCLDGTQIYASTGFAGNIANLAIIGNKGTGTQNNFLDVDDVVIDNSNIGTCSGFPATHTVTPSVGTPSGTISPSSPQTVNDGATATFTLAPAAGFRVDTVGGTCGGTLTGTSYTTNPVTADCTVVANFATVPANGPYHSPLLNHAVVANTNGTSLNLVTGAFDDTGPSGNGSPWDLNFWASGGALRLWSVGTFQAKFVISGTTAAVLPTGTVIGPSSTYSGTNTSVTPAAAWLAGADGALGFQFKCDGRLTNPVASPGICYGYARLKTTSPNGFPATVVEYWYDGDGQPITVQAFTTQVPPTVAKAFAPASVDVNVNSTATITLSNANATVATLSADLVDTLPAGLVASSATTTCGGTASFTAGTIKLASGATIPANGSCKIDATVKSATAGSYVNTIAAGALKTDKGDNAAAASATLTVTNVVPADIFCSATLNKNLVPTFDGTSINWITGVIDDVGGQIHWNPFNTGTDPAPLLAFFWPSAGAGGGVGTGTLYSVLQPGAVINSSSTFLTSSGSAATATWRAGADGYLGFKLGCTGGTCFGYAHVKTTGASGFPATLVDYCYNKVAGSPITIVAGTTTFTVTPSVGTPSGTISPNTPQTVNSGATATFTLAPAAGFRVNNVGGTCPAGTLTGNSYTTGAITANCTVIANFTPDVGGPVASVTPASINLSVEQGASDSKPLNIANTGGGSLTFTITEAAAGARTSPSSYLTAQRSLEKGVSFGPGTWSQAPSTGGSSGHPFMLDATQISQMADNTPGDQGVSCGTQGVSTADNSWWRRFYFNEHPQVGAAANITSVTVSSGSIAIPGGLPVTINLYTIPHSVTVNTIPTGQLTLIGTKSGVMSGSLATVTIPVTGTVSDTVGKDLVVEMHTDGNTSGGQWFPGANSTPETHPTFLSSATCGVSNPTTTAAIGFPDFHLTMVVTVDDGTPPPPPCQNPSDIPWLSASPTSGSVAGGANTNVTVAANTAGLALGTYSANVCVATNDPAHAMVTVPVALTVTQPPGSNNGIITSAPLNHTIAATTAGTSLNIVSSAMDDSGPISGNWDFNFWSSSNKLTLWKIGGSNNGQYAVDGSGNARLFQPGEKVGPSATFTTGTGSVNMSAGWLAGTQSGYLGVKFNCNGRLTFPVAAPGECYGYVRLKTTAPNGFPATILDTAFDGDGQEITITNGGGGTDPIISVTPASVSGNAPVGGSTTAPLTIKNIGGGNLTWTVAESPTSHMPPLGSRPEVPVIHPNAAIALMKQAPNSGANPNAAPVLPAAAGTAFAIINSSNDYISFDPATPGSVTHIGVSSGTVASMWGGGFLNGDTAVHYLLGDTGLKKYTAATRAVTTINASTGSGDVWAATMDPTSGKMYYVGPSSAQKLFSVDVATGTATQVGTITGSASGHIINALAADSTGKLWAVDKTNDTLVAIDKTTGASSSVGALGVDSEFVASLAFGGDGVLYFASALASGSNNLYSVNTTSGATTLIGALSDQIEAMAFGGGTPPPPPCQNLADVPWLSATPTSGSTAGQASSAVTVGLNATGLAVGTYTANLCVSSNDTAGHTLVVVPVTFTVSTGGAPVIEVTPASVAGSAATGSSTTVSMAIKNAGGGSLDWTIEEQNSGALPAMPASPRVAQPATEKVGAPVTPAGSTSTSGAQSWAAPTAMLYDNGPLITNPGAGSGGRDASALQTAVGNSAFGLNVSASAGFRAADDFTVPAGGWTVDKMTFFTYQTGSSTTSTITGVNVRIWNGVPGAAGSTVVFGDTTTNRIASSAFSNIYRVLDTGLTNTDRPIMAVVANIGTTLPAGTYWVDWQLSGSLASGPWAPPVTIAGQTNKPGANAVQFDGTSWIPAMDDGSSTQQDIPFLVEGTAGGGGAACSSVSDIPWLSLSATSGSTAGGATSPVTVTLNAAGLAAGTYTGNLCVRSNDNAHPLVVVPVSFEVTSGGDGLSCRTIDHAVEPSFDGTFIDWETGQISDGSQFPSAQFNAWASSGKLAFFWPSAHQGGGVATSTTGMTWRVLQVGDQVGPSSIFSSATGAAPTWDAGADGYLGFKFKCSTAAMCYGYLHMTSTGPNGFPATMKSYCYQPNGAAVTIGGGGGDPIAVVTPNPLTFSVQAGASGTNPLTIGNTGGRDLTYAIAEAAAARLNPPSYKTAAGRVSKNPDLAPKGSLVSRRALGGELGFGRPVILDDTMISQMADNTPGDEGVSCGTQGVSTADNSWWRRFYFNEHPQVGASANIASVTVSSGSIAIPGGLPVTINLYTIPHSVTVNTIPTGQLTLIGTKSGVMSGSLTSVTIPVTGTVSDTVGKDLVVEVHTDGNASGGQYFPGANATAETHPTFLSSSTCGVSNPTTAAGLGFPDFHMTMVVNLGDGGTPSGCQNPSDIPWLSETPASGTVAPGAQANVAVTANASTLAVGSYSANLCVTTNDPTQTLITVPVSLTVTPAPVDDGIFCSGFEMSEDGSCGSGGDDQFTQPLKDPSFEATIDDGDTNPFWASTDTNAPGGSVFYSASGFGIDVHTGDWEAWFGGWRATSETQTFSQTVEIKSGGPRFINYWRNVVAAPLGTATLKVFVDSTQVASTDIVANGVDANWTNVSVDISSFADNQQHTIKFEYKTAGADDGNVFVDDVTIDNHAGSARSQH